MVKYDNFIWLVEDISSSLILRLSSKDLAGNDTFYGIFDVMSILDTTGEKLVVKNSNIEDLTNLLTLAIVRFTNMKNSEDIIDVPLRTLYKLYRDSNKIMLDDGSFHTTNKKLKIADLEAFAVIDGTNKVDEYDITSCSIGSNPSEDLKELMDLAKEFGLMTMQQKMDALGKVNVLIERKNMYLI